MNGLTRRAFLGALAATPAMNVLHLFAQEARKGGFLSEGAYTKRLRDGAAQCDICPQGCTLKPGQTSFCRARANHDGRILTHSYGNPCILTVDPIEKLPLSHFLPGERTLSLAGGGCNLTCLYCQNWQQSQSRPDELKTLDVPPEKAVEGARKQEVRVLGFTYTEPFVSYEYLRDLTALSHEKGLKNVVASAFFVNPEPLRALCRNIDAFAVTLKGFDEKFYEKVAGGRLKPVLAALETARSEKVWLELINLVVPGYNDDLGKIREMTAWIAKNLGREVPIHFGRFVPEYRLKDLPRTPVGTLERCREIGFEEGLQHVYIFNVSPHEGNNTRCASCKKEVIQRLGFKTMESHVEKNACGYCRSSLPGVWTWK